jgi:hypothetical protein
MNLRPVLTSAAVAVLAVGAVTAGAHAAPQAKRQPAFAAADRASITPGVQTVTGASQCTANFVFTDGTGEVYLGQSAHCASTSGSTQTNGCLAGSLPLGTPVRVAGAAKPGTLVYSSWLAMQRAGRRTRTPAARTTSR